MFMMVTLGVFVDLKAKIYTCRVFDFDKLPCRHALTATHLRNINPFTLYSSYYQTKVMLCTYADPIMSVGNQADWTISAEIAFIKLLLPANRCKCERRKICRIPSADEEKIRVKCNRCSQISHNHQTFSNPLTLDEKREAGNLQ